ncbi:MULTISPECIES: hypothetical protein [Shewanella]|uniref:hypothetical protein n=1 Tax=Shewanella TaxID=22 RepID=UPI001C6616CD|nr:MULTISPECIES: hypothetical protein [Shewanella]QYJ93474.1 hypothetical protein K0I31_18145 [Shewanella spartinae]QYJ97362.1 hypothetical protein K0J45_17980 [Shewanella alkalitolerans]
MKTLIIATSLALLSPLSQANDITEIDSAANRMDIDRLSQLSEQSQGYEQAYALYRMAISANILSQKGQAQAALTRAEKTLTPIADQGEAATLLASVYGMQIGLDMSQAAKYSTKMAGALNDAETLVPQSPRLALVKAIAAYSSPKDHGGSMKDAIAFSSKAIDLYREPCDNICWGEAEAYTWRGLAKQNLGDKAGAIADWQAALQVQADYAWANFLLKQNH